MLASLQFKWLTFVYFSEIFILVFFLFFSSSICHVRHSRWSTFCKIFFFVFRFHLLLLGQFVTAICSNMPKYVDCTSFWFFPLSLFQLHFFSSFFYFSFTSLFHAHISVDFDKFLVYVPYVCTNRRYVLGQCYVLRCWRYIQCFFHANSSLFVYATLNNCRLAFLEQHFIGNHK